MTIAHRHRFFLSQFNHNIDITCAPTAKGWLYLAAVMDLYSWHIVGWAMSDSLHRQLVSDALQMAITVRQPLPGLLHHSDRGSQYASDDWQSLLTQCQMVGSMSLKGNCYDNAPMESFFGTFKTELTFHRDYATRNEARLDIFEYIEQGCTVLKTLKIKISYGRIKDWGGGN